MKVLGIIAEYNPFHNGHKYHLEEALALTGADFSVAVMSGNFLQRGEPALWDKRLRSKMAVENGVDLVVELPFAFACNNAEQFAYGGVTLLSGLGCITDLVFGCEGDFDQLQRTAHRLAVEDEGFKKALATALDLGLSFPAARTRALEACGDFQGAALLTEPNNILGVEYMKQCRRLSSSMKPRAIHRQDSGYNSTQLSGTMASAKAIRIQWMKTHSLQEIQGFIPGETSGVLQEVDPNNNIILNDFFQMLSYRLRFAPAFELERIYAVTEGLENLLKKAVLEASDTEQLIEGMKSRRYTRTRIQRALVQSLMGLTRQDYDQILRERLMYAHVLAFNEKGAWLLKQIKKQELATVPIYSNLSKELRPEDPRLLLAKYDLLSTDLYHLAEKKQIYSNSDLVLAPYFKKP